MDGVRGLGVEIRLEPAKVEVHVPPGTPVVQVLARDVAVGFLRRWALGTELDKWATTLLAAGFIDFVDLEDQPGGDALLEGLWAASAREPIPEAAVATARALAGRPGSRPGCRERDSHALARLVRGDLMDTSLVVDLLRGIVSSDRETREHTADEVTDVIKAVTAEGALTLAYALVQMRLVEDDPACQESQLHALYEPSELYSLPEELLDKLRYLDHETVRGSQVEYLGRLLP